jgi:cytoskeletal protein CcmA (bactofilin family)
MFKNKKPKMKNGSAQKSPSLNMISEGTKIKGSINSQTDLRIAGQIDGEANCKGKIIVSSTAHLDGNVTSVDADIAGKVEGTIKVSNKLTLRQTAEVGGDIYTKVLVVEEGAQINGSCRMGKFSEPLEDASDAEFEKESVKKEVA